MVTLGRLCSDNTCLELRLVDEGTQWCQCWLLTENLAPRFLGADSTKVILSRLLDGLAGAIPRPGSEWLGREVFWILSLAEAHHVLYVAREGADTLLLWQDAGTGTEAVSVMRLSPAQREEWVSTINSLNIAN